MRLYLIACVLALGVSADGSNVRIAPKGARISLMGIGVTASSEDKDRYKSGVANYEKGQQTDYEKRRHEYERRQEEIRKEHERLRKHQEMVARREKESQEEYRRRQQAAEEKRRAEVSGVSDKQPQPGDNKETPVGLEIAPEQSQNLNQASGSDDRGSSGNTGTDDRGSSGNTVVVAATDDEQDSNGDKELVKQEKVYIIDPSEGGNVRVETGSEPDSDDKSGPAGTGSAHQHRHGHVDRGQENTETAGGKDDDAIHIFGGSSVTPPPASSGKVVDAGVVSSGRGNHGDGDGGAVGKTKVTIDKGGRPQTSVVTIDRPGEHAEDSKEVSEKVSNVGNIQTSKQEDTKALKTAELPPVPAALKSMRDGRLFEENQWNHDSTVQESRFDRAWHKLKYGFRGRRSRPKGFQEDKTYLERSWDKMKGIGRPEEYSLGETRWSDYLNGPQDAISPNPKRPQTISTLLETFHGGQRQHRAGALHKKRTLKKGESRLLMTNSNRYYWFGTKDYWKDPLRNTVEDTPLSEEDVLTCFANAKNFADKAKKDDVPRYGNGKVMTHVLFNCDKRFQICCGLRVLQWTPGSGQDAVSPLPCGLFVLLF